MSSDCDRREFLIPKSFDDFYNNYFIHWDEVWVREKTEVGSYIHYVKDNQTNWEKYFTDNKIQILIYAHEEKHIGIIGYFIKDGILNIEELMIMPEYRGKGYAQELLRDFFFVMQKIHPECKTVLVSTNEKNVANKLYHKVGFKKRKEDFDFYENGESMIWYQKILTSHN